MKLHVRTIVLLVLFALLALFAGINWSAFTAPADLNLLVTRVSAPVGVVMLAVVAALGALYVIFLAQLETKSLLETSRTRKQLEKAQSLAEKAEASRFNELMVYLEEELPAIRRMQEELLTQSETAAVDLAETVLSETEVLDKRLKDVEDTQ